MCRALLEESRLGDESFLPNATSAAEGDNTIMELKVVQDLVRGRTARLPWGLILRVIRNTSGRSAVVSYITLFLRATLLGKQALRDGQLLKDIAWARAHMRVIDVWLRSTKEDPAKISWLESYSRVLLHFPSRLQA